MNDLDSFARRSRQMIFFLYKNPIATKSLPNLHSSWAGNSGATTRDGLVLDRWSASKSPDQRPIHQEVGEGGEPRSFRSGLQIAPLWLATHLLESPSSDTHTESRGEGLWENLEDELEIKGYYGDSAHAIRQLPGIMPISPSSPSWLDLFNGIQAPMSPEVTERKRHQEWKEVEEESPSFSNHLLKTSGMSGKPSPEYERAPHGEVLQHGLFDPLISRVPIPDLNEHDHYALSSSHISPLPTESYHTATPAGHNPLYEDAHQMSHLQPSFPLLSPAQAFDALHNDGFQSKSPYNGFAELRGHSEAPNEYTHDPSSFSNAPQAHIQFSQPSSGYLPAENLSGSPESDLANILEKSHNLKTFLDYQTLGNKLIHFTPQSNQPILPIWDANSGSGLSSDL